ncbi:O-antigen ligase family protein [Pontibacter ruber]|uniref:O-antigen ligase family protein n=1 Tax=Pontibacter ruber TaxID=1343895 RepID=A0ABW5CZ43_9BACT|nr:O-antigen ligase family protein [Pontibacter ruber]
MKGLLTFPDKEHVIQKAYFFCLLFVAVSLFSPGRDLTNLAVILLASVWVFEGKFSEKYHRLRANLVTIPFFILFLLYLIGVFYTEDIRAGFKSLETKAPLLVFPLVLGSASIKIENLKKVLLYFAIACVLCSLVALIYQSFVVLKKNDFNYFFSDGLVSIMQKRAVYYAIYVATSILILVNYLFSSFKGIATKQKVLTVAGIVFLLLILFLLATRASLIALLLILIITLVAAGIRYGKLKYSVILIALLFAFIATLSVVFPQTIARFKSLHNVTYDFSNTEEVYHFSGADSDTKWNGLNLRLAKWVCAFDLIKEHPLFGVGTGDVKNEMVEAYKRRNFTYAAQHRFDPHNQYLSTTVGLGIPALFILLACFLYPLYLAKQRKSWLLASFTLLIMFCALTESLLGSAQGIIFICFFLFLLLQSTATEKILNNSNF